MSTLFEITADFMNFYEMAAEDPNDQAFLDTLESLNSELSEKAEGYVAVIHQLEMEADKAKEMEAYWKARKSARQNAVKRIKETMLTAMQTIGTDKIDAGAYTIKVVGNGGKAPLIIDGEVPQNMMKVIYEPDNDLIRKFLEEGNEVSWAHIGERGKSIRIK